jgi:hypothetical protein
MPKKEMKFIACTPKFIPVERMDEAAELAVSINPSNRPPVEQMAMAATRAIKAAEADESFTASDVPADVAAAVLLPDPGMLAFLTTKYWGKEGAKLTVSFMDNPPAALRAKILAYANKWGAAGAGNVQFVESSDGDVRVARGAGGYYSYIGTDCRMIPKGEQTLNLQGFTMATPDSEFDRVVTHEFGHALGCPHEHARRAIINKLDPEKVVAYFMRTQGWSRQVVVQQILTPLEDAALIASPDADETSVMTYSFPGAVTKSGQPIVGGSKITDADRAFVSKVYPQPGTPVNPGGPVEIVIPQAGTYALKQ